MERKWEKRPIIATVPKARIWALKGTLREHTNQSLGERKWEKKIGGKELHPQLISLKNPKVGPRNGE